ncbi:MAG: type II secretion system protein [Desulfobacterales bacterium]|jgi:prepilin-type N-terminal cleavage/methylation domain-containing protein
MTTLSFIRNGFTARSQNGFTLVELIVTIVLVGLIGVFTTLFVYTGLNGYLRARDTSEGALRAQIALDRISMELRDIDSINTFAAGSQIDYTSRTLSGNRQILYSNGVISINAGNGARTLLDEIENFSMTLIQTDLNARGGDEVQAIEISFNFVPERFSRQFNARIFPRNMVAAPSGG